MGSKRIIWIMYDHLGGGGGGGGGFISLVYPAPKKEMALNPKPETRNPKPYASLQNVCLLGLPSLSRACKTTLSRAYEPLNPKP